jgi:septum formation protein
MPSWSTSVADPGPLLLASSSPRRRDLLELVGLPFEAVPPGVDESIDHGRDARDLVLVLAAEKAVAVAGRHPGRHVLAADTLVRVGGRLLGKPAGPAEAAGMLREMSGRWHEVLTGVVLLRADGWRGERVSCTEVRFADLAEEEVLRYAAGPEPSDKAGGYGIQGAAGWFVTAIRGSFSNVMGLPLEAVRDLVLDAGLPLPTLGGPEGSDRPSRTDVSADLADALHALVRASEAAEAKPSDRQSARRAIEQAVVVARLAHREGFGSDGGGIPTPG